MNNNPLNLTELDIFKRKLFALCGQYNVWIKRQTERTDSPSQPAFFYEVELSAKVNADEVLLREVKSGR